MGKEKGISLFYSGGMPSTSPKTVRASGDAPLQGDYLADLLAKYRAEAHDAGYSDEDIRSRERQDVKQSVVRISRERVILDGHELKLLPSVKAFYVLIASHPEGLLKESFSKPEYLYEYRDYYLELDRTRAFKSQNDTMSFELEKEARKYKAAINKAITHIEETHGHSFSLASCKIFGRRWRISARVESLMGTSLDCEI